MKGPGQALLICNLLTVSRKKLLRFGFRDGTNAGSDSTRNGNPSDNFAPARNLLRLRRPHAALQEFVEAAAVVKLLDAQRRTPRR